MCESVQARWRLVGVGITHSKNDQLQRVCNFETQAKEICIKYLSSVSSF